MNHKERFTRENLQPSTLQLIKLYYPSPRREKILTCCVRHLNGHYKLTCRDHLCPACCPKESYKIGKAQERRFLAHTLAHKKHPRLVHEVYTLPPHLHHLVMTTEGFKAWREATLATIREIHQADVAGVMNLHPIGLDPTVLHPHWDVLINGYVLSGERPREHRPQSIHYDDARAIYRRNLVHYLKLEGDAIPCEVDLFLDRKDGTFHTSGRRTWHRIRYSARHVYQPQFAWLQDGGSMGDWWYKPEKKTPPLQLEGSHVIQSLLMIDAWLKGRKRRIWFGYMQNRLARKTAAAFGRDHTGAILEESS